MADIAFWVIFAIGVAVVAALVVAGLIIGSAAFLDWLVNRLHIKAEILRAYRKLLEEREAERKANERA